ncbi:hypothetical protein BU16DRAFT_280736 [Lophium mytilinum]|uniref:Uncharacterized protein n=1 Tax=Lophium mytilinum TaxID=390894 RepID=A0A6A6R5T9_9PEZI|nr:hypothetical protein BU16DRAFT_280736 [Lophium mytilinum]
MQRLCRTKTMDRSGSRGEACLRHNICNSSRARALSTLLSRILGIRTLGLQVPSLESGIQLVNPIAPLPRTLSLSLCLYNHTHNRSLTYMRESNSPGKFVSHPLPLSLSRKTFPSEIKWKYTLVYKELRLKSLQPKELRSDAYSSMLPWLYDIEMPNLGSRLKSVDVGRGWCVRKRPCRRNDSK